MRTIAASPALGERRVLTRFSCEQALPQWRALVGESLKTGLIRDISPVGIGLLLDHEIDPQRRLRIELQSKTGALWHLKVLDVIHATPRNEEGWIVGGSFPAPLTDDQLKDLLT